MCELKLLISIDEIVLAGIMFRVKVEGYNKILFYTRNIIEQICMMLAYSECVCCY